MGLDGVELIIAAEETFGVVIADEEAERVVTVDDLFQLIHSKICPPNNSKCITASTFYALRRILAKHLNLDRRAISKESRLDALVPLDGRRELWRVIAKDAELVLPDLIRNQLLNYALMVIPAVSLLYGAVGIAVDAINDMNALIVASIGLAVAYALAKATEPLKIHFDQNTQTMDALTRTVLANNFSKISNDGREWSDADLYQSYIELVSQQLGIEKSKIKRHHKFVDDLGIDR